MSEKELVEKLNNAYNSMKEVEQKRNSNLDDIESCFKEFQSLFEVYEDNGDDELVKEQMTKWLGHTAHAIMAARFRAWQLTVDEDQTDKKPDRQRPES